MKKLLALFLFIVLFIVLLTGCAPLQHAVQTAVAETQAEWTEVPSQTPYPTYTQQHPQVVIQFQTRAVTLTFTPTPLFSPTYTVEPAMAPHGDGYYLVGTEIAVGVWRSMGDTSNCYWETTSRAGNILNYHFGSSGGTMYVAANAFMVRLRSCGDWVYLGP
jgi:hypothetical protein